MKHISFLFYLLIFSTSIYGQQVDLSYYLPQSISYNSDIPTPESVIGHEVGNGITHDKPTVYGGFGIKIEPNPYRKQRLYF